MPSTVQTVLHAYEFDIRTDAGKAAWRAFKTERQAGPRCFGPVFHTMSEAHAYDGATVTLDAEMFFDNQWNTIEPGGKGRRVFDWFLQAHGGRPTLECSLPYIRRGHYLEQTDEMRELRRNTNICGWCGHREAAQRGAVFCPACIGSEYLSEKDLYLTRMVAIDAHDGPRAELTDAERAHLLPLFLEAQTYGRTDRDKARIAKKRAEVAAKYEKALADATAERDAFTWLMDHGLKLDNVIYYSHRAIFSFGWRKPFGDAELASLQAALGAEFSWPYEIKCVNGRTLSSGTVME